MYPNARPLGKSADCQQWPQKPVVSRTPCRKMRKPVHEKVRSGSFPTRNEPLPRKSCSKRHPPMNAASTVSPLSVSRAASPIVPWIHGGTAMSASR